MADKSGDLKVPPVYSKEEIYRYVDLGLGRGVDGTDPTPWLNKTSFQVRNVKYDNIVGTDEGGAVQSYQREISSVKSQQTKIQASIVIPKSPVTIGADAEVSRSTQSSRRSIGRKVINRTIAFRDNLDDVPFGDTGECSLDDPQLCLTFEENLARWILAKLKFAWESAEETSGLKGIAMELPSANENHLKSLSRIVERRRRQDMQLIADGCSRFVEYFRITHYVSSIQLGAAEYQVLTQEEYSLAVKVGGKSGVQNIASVSVEQKVSSKRKKSSTERRYIGVINEDNKVERGSYGEAVVDVSIRPITMLIKNGFLNACMQKALMDYIEEQKDKSDGPFIICCGVEATLYLYVNKANNAVLATANVRQASEFYITPNDDKSEENEFYVVFYKQRESIKETDVIGRKYSVLAEEPDHGGAHQGTSVAFYLDGPVNVMGANVGPLFVRDTVSKGTCRFALNSRIVSEWGSSTPMSRESWIDGTEMFYIKCTRRRFKRNGYFAVRKLSSGLGPSRDLYTTSCVPSRYYHDNVNFFMLFSLLRREQVAAATAAATPVVSGSSEFLSVPATTEQQQQKQSREASPKPSIEVEYVNERDIELQEMN